VAVSRDLLHGRWLHAYEEDTEDEMVYRPADSGLPPARGRAGLELRPDGTFSELGPGPDDRPTETPGRWELQDDDTLVVETGAEGGGRRDLRITAADGGAIVVRKPGRG
jgi:hypothetical protein